MKKIRIGVILILVLLLTVWLYGMNKRIETITNITIEAGEQIPEVSSFIVEDKYIGEYDASISSVISEIPDIYTLGFYVKKKYYESTLTIDDTTPPTGKLKDHDIWLGDTLELEDFIENSNDVTHISKIFINEPDFTAIGTQKINISLTDTSGNETLLSSSLTIKEDLQAPVITGVKDISIFIGDRISYKGGITVVDNKDETPELIIDNSQVNAKYPGEYPVTYSSVDQSGNATMETCNVIVTLKPGDSLPKEAVFEIADLVLEEIITEDMTDKEKLWAIYRWVRLSFEYTGYSDKSSWLNDADRGLKTKSGDCFTYYAVGRILTERAGFETLPVTRREGYSSRHYWTLVKYNDEWYHYDTCPALLASPYWCFLKTDAEVAAYTKLVKNLKPGYYDYDPTGLPEVSTTKVNRY